MICVLTTKCGFAHSRTSDELLKGPVPDPTVYATAFKTRRFYTFSQREPKDTNEEGETRDVFNEMPTEEERVVMPETHGVLGREAILRTSLGDIHIKLFPAECPRTVENFWYAMSFSQSVSSFRIFATQRADRCAFFFLGVPSAYMLETVITTSVFSTALSKVSCCKPAIHKATAQAASPSGAANSKTSSIAVSNTTDHSPCQWPTLVSSRPGSLACTNL